MGSSRVVWESLLMSVLLLPRAADQAAMPRAICGTATQVVYTGRQLPQRSPIWSWMGTFPT